MHQSDKSCEGNKKHLLPIVIEVNWGELKLICNGQVSLVLPWSHFFYSECYL